MKIYMIMPVRNMNENALHVTTLYCKTLEELGHEVHFPPRDAPQDDPTGAEICRVHREAMIAADEVHVIWDVDSKGSHFDLGMAYALGKTIIPVCTIQPDNEGKSYWKAVIHNLRGGAASPDVLS